MNKRIFAPVLAAVLFALVEASSHAGLHFLESSRSLPYKPISYPLTRDTEEILKNYLSGTFTYLIPDPALGWTVKPGSRESGLYRSNNQGLRGDREYAIQPENGKIRIAAFGDSFTHGDDVSNSETWETGLEAKDIRFEVLNFGVSGYGIDQAFLRYQSKGKNYFPRIVLIGFMSENICRSISSFRPFYLPSSGIPLGKPRFKIEQDRLVVVPNPMPEKRDIEALLRGEKDIYERLKANDGYEAWRYKKGNLDFLATVRLFKIVTNNYLERFRKEAVFRNGEYNRDSEAYRVTLRILREFYAEAIKNDSAPVIVIFPTSGDVNNYLQKKRMLYGPLMEDLRKKGMRFIDLAPALAAYPGEIGDLFNGHLSAKGNALAAPAIYDYLKKQELV